MECEEQVSKGKRSVIGDENVSANGYTYIKTASGWRLKHHIIAEQTLNRPLTKEDRVSFADNDRTNFAPDNILVARKAARNKSHHDRRVHRIEELMIDIVEDHPDKHQALSDLADALGNVRSLHGFSSRL